MDQSIAIPKRRWGLIIVVLVFDLGLAAAGAYLLNEGLSAGAPAPKPEAAPGSATVKTGSSEQRGDAVASGSAAGSAAPAGSAKETTTAPGSAGGSVAAGSAGSASAGSAAATTVENEAGSAGTTQGRKTITPRKIPAKGGKPIDPYDDKSQGSSAGPPPPPDPPQGPPPPP